MLFAAALIMAACAAPGSGPSAPATARATAPPPLDERERGEQFRRNQEANDGFRERGELTDAARQQASGYAERVRRDLKGLRDAGRFDAGSVSGVLTASGLTDVTVRRPGRLDTGAGDGLVFAGWTGRACVIGRHSERESVVEIGTRIADGGCLPAPD